MQLQTQTASGELAVCPSGTEYVGVAVVDMGGFCCDGEKQHLPMLGLNIRAHHILIRFLVEVQVSRHHAHI